MVTEIHQRLREMAGVHALPADVGLAAIRQVGDAKRCIGIERATMSGCGHGVKSLPVRVMAILRALSGSKFVHFGPKASGSGSRFRLARFDDEHRRSRTR